MFGLLHDISLNWTDTALFLSLSRLIALTE